MQKSIVLNVDHNTILTKDNNYCIKFNTGLKLSSIIRMNEAGDKITFRDKGNYSFTLCGEATSLGENNAKIVFSSDKFKKNIKQFTETSVIKVNNKLYLRSETLLPICDNQTVSVKLIPENDSPIVIISGTRLIISQK